MSTSTYDKPKVLCIDDDPAITNLIRMRLSRYDLDVRTASDGTEGMWLAMNEPPDVIITDLKMPHGDGDYVVECLKGGSSTCEIPVIALTGQKDHDIELWMKTLGVEHYLHKPPQFQKLLAALKQYVNFEPALAT